MKSIRTNIFLVTTIRTTAYLFQFDDERQIGRMKVNEGDYNESFRVYNTVRNIRCIILL